MTCCETKWVVGTVTPVARTRETDSWTETEDKGIFEYDKETNK